MSLTLQQQLLEHLERSQRVLIVVPKIINLDALSSALALADTLKKKQKGVEVLCEGWNEHSQRMYGYLTGKDMIRSSFTGVRTSTIILDMKKTPIEEVSYDVKDDRLTISLRPKKGNVTLSDLTVETLPYPFDTVIALGAADLDSIGSCAAEHADFFYSTPIINIDTSTENEHYGQWPLVDVTAASVAEIIFRLHDVLGKHHIDADTATLLLTGMIAATRSFATANVTPQTLQMASQLITLGARRQEIIHHLYWNRSVGSLKLFGKVLSRIQHDEKTKCVWSAVTGEDLLETHLSQEILDDVANELFHTTHDAHLFILFYPGNTHEVHAKVLSRRTHLLELLKPYQPEGTAHQAMIRLKHANILDAQKELMEFLAAKIPAHSPT